MNWKENNDNHKETTSQSKTEQGSPMSCDQPGSVMNKISFGTVCMNRLDQLKKTYPNIFNPLNHRFFFPRIFFNVLVGDLRPG